MSQRDRFNTEAEYLEWLKLRKSEGGKAKNKRKGFGTNRDLAKKFGGDKRKSVGE